MGGRIRAVRRRGPRGPITNESASVRAAEPGRGADGIRAAARRTPAVRAVGCRVHPVQRRAARCPLLQRGAASPGAARYADQCSAGPDSRSRLAWNLLARSSAEAGDICALWRPRILDRRSVRRDDRDSVARRKRLSDGADHGSGGRGRVSRVSPSFASPPRASSISPERSRFAARFQHAHRPASCRAGTSKRSRPTSACWAPASPAFRRRSKPRSSDARSCSSDGAAALGRPGHRLDHRHHHRALHARPAALPDHARHRRRPHRGPDEGRIDSPARVDDRHDHVSVRRGAPRPLDRAEGATPPAFAPSSARW